MALGVEGGVDGATRFCGAGITRAGRRRGDFVISCSDRVSIKYLSVRKRATNR